MSKINRRNVLRVGLASVALPSATILNLGCGSEQTTEETKPAAVPDNQSDVQASNADEGNAMTIQYLEIVTSDVDGQCKVYSEMHGVTFSEPEANLGGARTAKLASGGMIGIRGPLRDTETPVVRPYMLTEDIKAAVAAAADAGAEIAMPPTPIPDKGQFAIVIHGGIESGMWQL